MRLAFAGTPEFAAQALDALIKAGHEIVLVMTQPDRPAGRGLKLQPSAVKALALKAQLALIQPQGLRLDGPYGEDARAAQTALAAAAPDAIVVAAYGLILPQWVLSIAPRGCLNIHASLLPRWRGAAPIQRAIEAGDEHSGVSIMQMDASLDTGDVLLMQALPILPSDTSSSLHDKLAVMGATLMVRALSQLSDLQPQKQAPSGVTYAAKIERAEAAIDWSEPADVIERRIRAFNPFPVATTQLADAVLKVWSAQVAPEQSVPDALAPGSVMEVSPAGIKVLTGNGALLLTELQRAGARRMPLPDFLRGCPIERHSRLA